MVDRSLKKQLKNKYGNMQIYVVPASEFSAIPNGFTRTKHYDNIWSCVDNKGRYVFRYDAEYEPSMQQPIPYILIKHPNENKFFVSKRIKGEERLLNQYSLGFGGHIDLVDGTNQVLLKAFNRELNEELIISKPIEKIEFVGNVRNLESSTADHTGFVFVVQIDQIAIREKENLVGEWLTVEDLEKNYHKFEDWAKHIIDYVVIHNYQL